MKIKFLSLVIGATLCFSLYSWELRVHNNTEYTAQKICAGRVAGRTVCQENVPPGGLATLGMGEYLNDSVYARLFVSKIDPAQPSKPPKIEVVETSPYTSSGQRYYEDFKVVGPDKNGNFSTGRFVQ